MNKYHKIQTVFLRDPQTKYKTLLEGQWSKPEFEFLKNVNWVWTEKIDGTNIRVIWPGSNGLKWAENVFAGKTDKADIHPNLMKWLKDVFVKSQFQDIFGEVDVCLYGEGYGNVIQNPAGKRYLPDCVRFILFDVRIGDMWLKREDVEDIANKFAIDCVPIVGNGPLADAIQKVKIGFKSTISVVEQRAEGLIMKPEIELKDRLGKRIITKLKTKDFAK